MHYLLIYLEETQCEGKTVLIFIFIPIHTVENKFNILQIKYRNLINTTVLLLRTVNLLMTNTTDNFLATWMEGFAFTSSISSISIPKHNETAHCLYEVTYHSVTDSWYPLILPK